jgi:7-cyano-7-deazaguanine synthase
MMSTFRERNVCAMVLFSGGIDSATTLHLALREFRNVHAVSIDYGQRHKREIDYAFALAHQLSVTHTVLQLHELLSGQHVMLTQSGIAIPAVPYDQIEGISPTYVPYRNGVMLSALAAHASKYITHAANREHVGCNSPDLKDLVTLYFGAHAEDAKNWAYPDCTPEFIGAQANAIYIGSYQTVRLRTPFMYNTKADIVRAGAALGVPYELTWSCYEGGDKHCGVCPTCRARKRAFVVAGVDDPTEYAA